MSRDIQPLLLYNSTSNRPTGILHHPSQMSNPCLLFVATLIFLLPCHTTVALGDDIGGWRPITNVTDPTVVDIAMFAVDEHNKEHQALLKFGKLVKGQSQVVSGLKYKLTIEATDNTAENNYEAVVWVKPWQKFRQLLSFQGPI